MSIPASWIRVPEGVPEAVREGVARHVEGWGGPASVVIFLVLADFLGFVGKADGGGGLDEGLWER